MWQRHSGFLLSLSSFGRPVIRSLTLKQRSYETSKQRQAQWYAVLLGSRLGDKLSAAARRRLSAAAPVTGGAPAARQAGAAESRSLSAYTHSPLPFHLSSLIWLSRGFAVQHYGLESVTLVFNKGFEC